MAQKHGTEASDRMRVRFGPVGKDPPGTSAAGKSPAGVLADGEAPGGIDGAPTDGMSMLGTAADVSGTDGAPPVTLTLRVLRSAKPPGAFGGVTSMEGDAASAEGCATSGMAPPTARGHESAS